MKLLMVITVSFLVLRTTSTYAAQTGFVLTPGTYATTEGDSAVGPLSGQLPSRFQQVDSASEFTSTLPSGGAYLGSLTFRTDGPLGINFMTTISDLQITLSTTLRTPDGLSSTFADNVGADATVVIGPGPLFVQGAHGPFVGEPMGFGTQLVFSNPFFYDPSAGNLLIDIRTIGNNSAVSVFDAVSLGGDSVSSVYSFNGNLLSGQTDTRGNVTLFTWGVVPEPSLLLLLVPACAPLFVVKKRRNQTN